MPTRSSAPAAVKPRVKKTAPKRAAKAVVKRAPKTTKPKKVAVKKATPKKRAATKKAVAKKKTAAKKRATKPKRGPIPDAPLDPSAPLPSYTIDAFTQIKRAPLGHLMLEQQLREAGFRGGVSTDPGLLDAYSTDESIFSIRPQIVIQPKDQKDVEVAVRTLGTATKQFPAVSLTPRAAGTGLSGGSLTDSVALDMATFMHHCGEAETVHGHTTITCEPGTPWRVVERHLKKHRVYIPSYPASKDLCTIGGAVANNAAGPDSLRYGHTANWVESLNVTLHDGNTYAIAPLSYKEYKALIATDSAYAEIAKAIFALIQKNEKFIQQERPKTTKNTAGYAIWDVLSTTVASFKKGNGAFDLTKLIAGSQGTIGIITSVMMRTTPLPTDTELIVMPVFDRLQLGTVVEAAREYEPLNLELYDGHTYDLALSHPEFFRSRLGSFAFYRVMFTLYATYHVRYKRRLPAFTVLMTLDQKALGTRTAAGIAKSLRSKAKVRARVVSGAAERELHWQVRHASYALSKLQDTKKRPAAFLEDMAVPPKELGKFVTATDKLFKQFNIRATVHGHGGDGHLQFYPLLDFSSKSTGLLIEKMATEFFAAATKLGGSICGEHNDGIIRTPHISKLFSKQMIKLFEQIEHIFDPDDIFNPGKKVHPRYDISTSIRRKN